MLSMVFHAIQKNDLKFLDYVIQKGCSIDVKDDLGCTPLHWAVKKSSRGCLNVLLNQPTNLINAQNNDGSTSLYLACENKRPHLNLIKDLLEDDADPNISNHKLKTPFHMACENGNLDLVKLLHKYNADINAQDSINKTPLHWVILLKQKDIIQYLLQNGADTSIKNNLLNALMYALVVAQEEIAEMILPFTEDLNTTGEGNTTALWMAVEYGYFEIVKMLVEHGANVNIVDQDNCLLYSSEFYEKNNYVIFEYLWGKLDHKLILSVIEGLLKDQLQAYNHLPQLLIILESKVELKTALDDTNETRVEIFENIFNAPWSPDKGYFDSNKESLVMLIHGLVRQNLNFRRYSELHIFLIFLQYCPYFLELLEIVLQDSELELFECDIFKAFIVCPQFGIYLFQYCKDLGKLYTVIKELKYVKYLKYIFRFVTPNHYDLNDVICYRFYEELFDFSDILNSLKDYSKNAKNLVEISRDQARKAIATKYRELLDCNKRTKQFSDIVNNLDIPLDVKDILLYKKPVNI